MKLKNIFGMFAASFVSFGSTAEAKTQANDNDKTLEMIKKGDDTMSAVEKEATPQSIEIAPGLMYQQIQAGNGEKPNAGDTVAVHYAGKLTDGTEFDNSFKRGEPIKFSLGTGQVIKGWDLGIAQLSIGEKGILTISPELGYGEHGAGGVIPGNATLVFEVELVAIG